MGVFRVTPPPAHHLSGFGKYFTLKSNDFVKEQQLALATYLPSTRPNFPVVCVGATWSSGLGCRVSLVLLPIKF